MRLENVYNNKISFNASGSFYVAFQESNINYSISLGIDDKIIINNISFVNSEETIGSDIVVNKVIKIGTSINLSNEDLSIYLSEDKFIINKTGNYTVYLDVKEGMITNSGSYIGEFIGEEFVIKKGYSFNTKGIMTSEDEDTFKSTQEDLENETNEIISSTKGFAFIDKLTPGNITTFIKSSLITNNLIANGTIEERKLHEDVKAKLALSNTSLQNINLNRNILEKTNGIIDLNISNKVLFENHNEFNLDENNVPNIDLAGTQPRLSGSNRHTQFITYGENPGDYSSEPRNTFSLKSSLITLRNRDFAEYGIYSSKAIKHLLDNKVDISLKSVTELNKNAFNKFNMDDQGLVLGGSTIEKKDITEIIDETQYYKKKEFKKIISSPNLTIFMFKE